MGSAELVRAPGVDSLEGCAPRLRTPQNRGDRGGRRHQVGLLQVRGQLREQVLPLLMALLPLLSVVLLPLLSHLQFCVCVWGEAGGQAGGQAWSMDSDPFLIFTQSCTHAYEAQT